MAAVVAAALAGCSGGTYTSSCNNSECTVTLSGQGVEANINDDSMTVVLVGASDGVAEFSIDGESASCMQGEDLTVSGHSVTCTEVGGDRLVLTIR